MNIGDWIALGICLAPWAFVWWVLLTPYRHGENPLTHSPRTGAQSTTKESQIDQGNQDEIRHA